MIFIGSNMAKSRDLRAASRSVTFTNRSMSEHSMLVDKAPGMDKESETWTNVSIWQIFFGRLNTVIGKIFQRCWLRFSKTRRPLIYETN